MGGGYRLPDGYVVSDTKGQERKNVFAINNIPYSKEKTLIIVTADSKEILDILGKSDYNWIQIPKEIWKIMEWNSFK